MKLRFQIDQAACFRNGIDAPKSIVTIDVDPQKIPADDRNLIADRMDGIDVCQLTDDGSGRLHHGDGRPRHILALTPTYEGLMTAIREQIKEVEAKRSQKDAFRKRLREEADNIRRMKKGKQLSY